MSNLGHYYFHIILLNLPLKCERYGEKVMKTLIFCLLIADC